MGTDCKSVSIAYVGSNPTRPNIKEWQIIYYLIVFFGMHLLTNVNNTSYRSYLGMWWFDEFTIFKWIVSRVWLREKNISTRFKDNVNYLFLTLGSKSIKDGLKSLNDEYRLKLSSKEISPEITFESYLLDNGKMSNPLLKSYNSYAIN